MAEPTIEHGRQAPADGAALLVHGGAWDIPDDMLDAHREGLRQAIDTGRKLLREGAPAIEVAAETVAVLEAHGAFDAGYGAMLRRDGSIELDAGLMDGPTLDYGSVIGVRRLPQPIRVAHRLLTESNGQAQILTRDGAERFAAAQGFTLVDNATLISERERRRYERLRADADFHTSDSFLPEAAPRGTVGCVVRDRSGRLAAATSTGGTPFAPAGRVGDSPLPGSGFYANEHGAASATGWGEAIVAMMLGGRAVDALEAAIRPDEAARRQLDRMRRQIQNAEGEGATGGLIVMDASGQGGWAFSTPRMARGGWCDGADSWVKV